MKTTDRVLIVDTAGYTLAVFQGFDCPSVEELRATYPTFKYAKVFTKRGLIRMIIR